MSRQISVLVARAATSGYNPTSVPTTVNCETAIPVHKDTYIATSDYHDRTVNSVKAGDEVPVNHPAVKKQVLRIEDTVRGTLWVEETFQSFHDKCQACCQ